MFLHKNMRNLYCLNIILYLYNSLGSKFGMVLNVHTFTCSSRFFVIVVINILKSRLIGLLF